ncbi:MAG: hypothetical protein HY098_09170 [Nitrospinae bacterium]|nr:hypothetical protein [Nitrospinota bacterium]
MNIASATDRFGLHHLTPRWVEKGASTSFAPEKARVNFERFFAKVAETEPALLKKLSKRNIPLIASLFSGSQALSDTALRNPRWLFWALGPGILDSTRFKRDMRHERDALSSRIPNSPKEALCDFKNRELLRIGWRDLLKWADTVETLDDLSRLADVTVEGAMNVSRFGLRERFGEVANPDGSPGRFIVLGMGKLGGRELNFSSDIDLIYVYENDEGETEGGLGKGGMERHKISAREFYSFLAQQTTSMLNDIGPSGNLYRVDLGLRPDGNRGPIACSLAYAGLYYESWGQPWERQMMIKARVVAGDSSFGDEFFRMIRPFVYRKYLDFSALKEIQLMKEKIDASLKTGKNKFKNNVKLGKGGIREVEFIIQAHQLIYGGKAPWFAETNSLKALHRIFERGLIGFADYARLADALLFLRDLENRMQITYGRQVQILPDGDELGVLALKMNLRDQRALMDEYERHTNNVDDVFTNFFREEVPTEEETPELFLDLENEEAATARLAEMRFENPADALSCLLHIRDGEPFNHPSAKSRRMLTRLLPQLTGLLAAMPAKDRALKNLDSLLSSSPARESLYQMLADYPPGMETLVKTLSCSQNMAEAMINMPDVAELLGSAPDPTRPDPLAAMPANLGVYEKKLDWLRKERNSESLRIGVAYLMAHNDPFRLMRQLTELACSFVQRCLDLIDPEPTGRFAVIGMGKLGRRELTYGSDLDLVFVYSSEGEAALELQSRYATVASRLLGAVGGISQYGLAYKVDARLRPEGEKGIIVLSAAAASDYYATRGSLWERMALCGARAVAGDLKFGSEFLKNLDWFVYGAGFSKKDEAEMERMKKRMEREKAKSAKKVALKYGPGGIVDVEFLAQKLKLARALTEPDIKPLNTFETLVAARERKWPVEGAAELADAYRFFRIVELHMRMEYGRGAETLPDDPKQMRLLEEIIRPFFQFSGPLADKAHDEMDKVRILLGRKQ